MVTLGSVGPSRTSVLAPAPRTPDLFSGLQGALGRAQDSRLALDQANLDARAAEDDRQLKIARAKALSLWSQTKADVEIGQAELARTYDPSGSEYAGKASELAQSKFDAFFGSIPEALRTEFEPDVAEYSRSRQTVTYDAQVSMEGNYWKKGLADLQKKATDEIFTGKATIEDWMPEIQRYVDTSPLPELETQLLVEDLNHTIQATEYAIQVQDEITNWFKYDDTNSEGIPAGMPGYMVGMLGLIGQEESGMRFDVINGGETFTDTTDHPRKKGAGGSSTAAGAFQFVAGTWDEAKAALGLKDFSPASQWKAAWWLAGRDYKARTGRDIDADLASGDPVLIEQVRKTLAGQGDEGVTWQALQGVSSEAFFAAVTGGKAIPPGALSDPTYDALSAQEKANGWTLAQNAAADARVAALQAQNEQRNMLIEGMRQSITAGTTTQADLTKFAHDNFLTQGQTGELQNLFDAKHADDISLMKFGAALQNPSAIYGTEERKGFEVLYAREGRAKLAEGDQAYMNNNLLPAIIASHIYPEAFVGDLLSAAKSSNAKQSVFAMQNMALLQQQDPRGFRQAFGEQAESDVQYYRTYSQYDTPETVMARMRDAEDPNKKPQREFVDKLVTGYVKDQAKWFTPESIAGEMGLEFDPTVSDPMQSGALQAEFLELFKQEMARYQDGGLAYDAAVNRLKSVWSVSNAGAEEGYLLRNGPALAGVPAVGGSYDWLDTIVRADMGLPPEARYRLVSDHITEYRIQQSAPPSYMVEVYNAETGLFLPAIDDATGYPKRTAFTPTEAKSVGVDSTLWFRKSSAMDKAYQSAKWATDPQQSAMLREGDAAVMAEVAKLTAYGRSVLEAEIPLGGSTKGFSKLEGAPNAETGQALLGQFGFASVSEFASFMVNNDVEALAARYQTEPYGNRAGLAQPDSEAVRAGRAKMIRKMQADDLAGKRSKAELDVAVAELQSQQPSLSYAEAVDLLKVQAIAAEQGVSLAEARKILQEQK